MTASALIYGHGWLRTHIGQRLYTSVIIVAIGERARDKHNPAKQKKSDLGGKQALLNAANPRDAHSHYERNVTRWGGGVS